MALYFESEQGRFSAFFRSKTIRFSFLAGLFLNLASWIIIGRWVLRAPVSIPLHYNIYFGIDLFGDWAQLFIAPAFGLGIFIINCIAGVFLYEKDRILSYFLVCIAAAVELILLIASLMIIFIDL